MKKMLLLICVLCLLFTYCKNKDHSNKSDKQVLCPPHVTAAIHEKIRYKDTIPLKEAEQYINAFRDGGQALFIALSQGKHGVRYKAENITNFSSVFLTKFICNHQKAVQQGYNWEVGTAFAVKKTGTTHTMNFLVYPVLVSGSQAVLDYFELKRKNAPELKLYLPDNVVHTLDPQYPDTSFVFDEGALWP